MKKITTLVIGILLVSWALAEETQMPIPLLAQVNRIGILSGVWQTDFYSDGSAGLIFGTGATHRESPYFPEGSFAIGEIYNLVVPHLKPNQVYNEDVRVVLLTVLPDGEHTTVIGRGYVEDTETIRKIMYRLRDKVAVVYNPFLDKAVFAKLIREYPLVQGDDADGNPIPGYVRTPYIPMEVCDDPFADNPKQPQAADDEPKDDGAAVTPPQPAIQEKPPEPPAVEQTPAVGDKTTTDIAEGESSQAENNASNRWLFAGIVLALATAFYLLRRRK